MKSEEGWCTNFDVIMVLCCDTCCVCANSKNPVKIMEKTRVGDQTVCSSYSPGECTYTYATHAYAHTRMRVHTHTQAYMYTCIGIVRMRRYTCMSSSTTKNVLFKLPCYELSLLGGFYLVTGGTDHVIRIYKMYPTPNPEPWEMLGHTVSVTIKYVIVFNIHFASTHQ